MVGRRWSTVEENALAEVKRRLKDQLAARPQFPEVVGDRRLMRFLRGKALNIDESCKMISAFLKWRDDNHVDDVRQDIVYGGKDTPYKFPFGKIIIDLAPQIIISANSLDKKGRPLAMEMFDFSPKDVLEAISIADYLVFLTYSLEYRAIVLEQMSHEREQAYLAAHPNPEDRQDGYGVMILDYTIRDLKGVGMAHLSSKGRALVGAALELGLPNYQEYLGKCVMINTPWIFNTFWYFVKGFLDEETIAKINLCGHNYMNVLLEDMTIENIPERLGGKFKLYNEPYEFDKSVGGPLHCGIANEAPAETDHAHHHHHHPHHRRGSAAGSGATKPPLGRGLRIDTTMSPLSMSSGMTGAAMTPNTPLTPSTSGDSPGGPWDFSRDPMDTPGRTDPGSASSTDLTSLTISEPRERSSRASGVVTGPTRSAASMLFSHANGTGGSSTRRGSVLQRDESVQSSLSSTSTINETDSGFMPSTKLNPHAPATTVHSPPHAHAQHPHSELGPHRPSLQSVQDGKLPADSHHSTVTTNSLSSKPSTPTSPATPKQWAVMIALTAIWSEFCEFWSSLFLLLTRYPLSTATAASIFSAMLYLRVTGKLHLLVFPVLLLTIMLRFELLQ